jgi:uncharacterized coiled-coil DUF342 family protein
MTTADDVRRQIDGLKETIRTKQLSPDDFQQLVKELKKLTKRLEAKPNRKMRDITELQGLGKELWQSIDVDEYLKQEREAWR